MNITQAGTTIYNAANQDEQIKAVFTEGEFEVLEALTKGQPVHTLNIEGQTLANAVNKLIERGYIG